MNYYAIITIVQYQVVIIGIFLLLGHVAGGVVSAIYASELSDIGGLVRNGLAASAVSHLLHAHFINYSRVLPCLSTKLTGVCVNDNHYLLYT